MTDKMQGKRKLLSTMYWRVSKVRVIMRVSQIGVSMSTTKFLRLVKTRTIGVHVY